VTAAYDSPEQHLGETIELVRLVLAAATRLRLHGDDDEHARLRAAARAQDQHIRARIEASPPALVPLEKLRAIFGLTPTEGRVIAALAAFELETTLRAEARALMADPQRLHPDVGLLAALIYDGGNRRRVSEELGGDGRLARFALVRFDRLSDAPFALRRARVAQRVLDLLHGRDVVEPELARHLTALPPRPPAELVLADGQLDEVRGLVAAALAATTDGVTHPVVLLAGPDGAGRKTMLAAAAHGAGLRVLRVGCAGLPRDEAALRALGPAVLREAILAHALVILDGLDQLAIDNAQARVDEVLFEGFPWPIAGVVDRITGRPPQLARGAVVVEVGPPGEAAREQLWQRALGVPAGAEVATWAAQRYTITPGLIARAGQSARAKAASRGGRGGDAAIGNTDVHEGLRSALDAKLVTLGTRIAWRQSWDDLVLGDDVVADVKEFIARVQHRRRVYDQWGFGRKVAKGLGLSALFSGPPGTGKTMCAGLIADALQLDLYQVDLSKVVSKWIGETEKNLGGLFDAAEAGHAILLFDEADSLFAKRTQVQSSNDRYANLEVNYLLQRMEAFAGITILTTNNDTAVDEAFTRRLSLKVDFPVPERDERETLWRRMIPAEAAIAPGVDFGMLAQRFEMTGGYIKNAAVRAAFLAAADGTAITTAHLVRAAKSEYQAMGKIISHL